MLTVAKKVVNILGEMVLHVANVYTQFWDLSCEIADTMKNISLNGLIVYPCGSSYEGGGGWAVKYSRIEWGRASHNCSSLAL